MSDEETEKRRKAANVVLAYHRTFDTKEGKAVLDHLASVFRFDLPCFTFEGGHAESHLAAVRDGQRSVYLHIQAVLSRPPVADGNIKQKSKVKRPDSPLE